RDLPCVGAASFVAATTAAPPRPCSRRGRIPRARRARKPSHYRSVPVRMPVLSWIMLLLSLGVLEHGMIDASRTPDRAPDYESGGQEFEFSSGAPKNQAFLALTCLLEMWKRQPRDIVCPSPI